jgi:hypothetical protein
MKKSLILALTFGLSGWTALAQDAKDPAQTPLPPPTFVMWQGGPGGPGGHGGPGGPGRCGPPPGPPIFMLIDSDKDGMLSADEVKKAAEVLAKFDKNGDGNLTPVELCPPPPAPPEGGEKKKDAAGQ